MGEQRARAARPGASRTETAGCSANVVLSVGLWTGNPDLDAVQTLANGVSDADRRLVSEVVNQGAPERAVLPDLGHEPRRPARGRVPHVLPPDGAELALRAVRRHLGGAGPAARLPSSGVSIVCGRPLVEHRRASDPFVNLEREGSGIGANERVWEIVDRVELHEATPLACMREVGAGLERVADGDEYVRTWGRAIGEWCRLFEREA